MSDPAESRADAGGRPDPELAALRARVEDLERAVELLRREIGAASSPRTASYLRTVASSAPPPTPAAAGVPGEEWAAAPPPPPAGPPDAGLLPATAVRDLPRAAPPPGESARRSLEARVGSQWLNRVGILALLTGVAWFLKYAFDQQWVGPAGRVSIGLAAGALLIAWSERFRARNFAAFSYSLKALGAGVLYLSLWAGFALYHLLPPAAAFGGMVAVTALNAFIAWRQSAEMLAVYAIVGGFSTPLLLSTGRSEEGLLFGYLLTMNAATLALLVLKGWSRLLVLSFLGTTAFFWGWYWRWYRPADLTETAVFLSLFVVLFAVATVAAGGRRSSDPAHFAVRALTSLANAASGFLGFYAMLSRGGSASRMPLAWCAIAFAAFYLGPGRRMARRLDGGGARGPLADVQLAIATIFLTLAVPLAVRGNWITVGWMAEGAGMVWVAARSPARLLRWTALGALGLGLASLAMDATVGQTRVLWNTRFLTFAVAMAAFWASARVAGRARDRDAWRWLPTGFGSIAGLLLITDGLLEIHTYWWSGAAPGEYGPGSLLVADTALTSTMWLALLGAAAGWRWRAGALPQAVPAAGAQLALGRWSSPVLLASALAVLPWGLAAQRATAVFNLRFATFLVTIAALWIAAWSQGRSAAQQRLTQAVQRAVGLAANAAAVIAGCLEVSTYWATRAPQAQPGSPLYAAQMDSMRMAARFTESAWLLLAGSLLLATGFRRRSAWLRWQGLVLLGVAVVKVFLFDTRSLSQGYHIVSFLTLGALLLAVSFAYQRDWLKLRAPAAERQ